MQTKLCAKSTIDSTLASHDSSQNYLTSSEPAVNYSGFA